MSQYDRPNSVYSKSLESVRLKEHVAVNKFQFQKAVKNLFNKQGEASRACALFCLLPHMPQNFSELFKTCARRDES